MKAINAFLLYISKGYDLCIFHVFIKELKYVKYSSFIIYFSVYLSLILHLIWEQGCVTKTEFVRCSISKFDGKTILTSRSLMKLLCDVFTSEASSWTSGDFNTIKGRN